VIYAGPGVLHAEATPELVELAELLNAPTMTTTLGKSGFPQKTCFNLIGDVAVGMAGTDFETAAREQLGIITVIVNNSAMAQSLGAHAKHVTDPNWVGPAIERAREISTIGQPLIAMPPCYPVGARLCYENHHHIS